MIDNLPGVSVQEGDAYSFDDWSSNVVMRGFQTTYNDAQIGTTIDGFPNGTSDYWSGAKANRFVDPMNLGGVEVLQGTADIASRSVEALGGTLNFLTADPSEGASQTASVTIGENEGQRFARAGRDRIAVRRHDAGVGRRDPAGGDRLDGGLGEKRAGAPGRPRSCPRTATWSSPATSPTTTSTRMSTSGFSATRISLSAGVYRHHNWGRGDWLPPFIVDDGAGPESELAGRAPVRSGNSALATAGREQVSPSVPLGG